MKPQIKLATTRTPDGGEMALFTHDGDFLIKINGQELMSSRQHESEEELARLGCAHLAGRPASRVLIGGLGMGYTLRQALDSVGHDAKVLVSELLPAVVDWNHEFLGDLNGQALADKRTEVIIGNILPLLSTSMNAFDAILLDIDNGPSAMTDAGNQRLYSPAGIQSCRRALRKKGCLAVWSAEPSKAFERLLLSCDFHVRRFRVPAYKGSKTRACFVWIAAEDVAILPPGGVEPRQPQKRAARSGHR